MRAKRMSEQEIERQTIEYVFGLTGGELETDPLIMRTVDGEEYRSAYWYEGVPEWAVEDFDRDARHSADGHLTIIGTNYYAPPHEVLIDADGVRWKRVQCYSHSGECPCPVPENHPGKVTRDVATLRPKLDVIGYGLRAPRKRTAECQMCEARIGEEHGYLYVGDSSETVYQRESEEDEIDE